MRVWDIEPKRLCRKHLLGEHRELHAIWSVLTNNKTGYAKHPETLRWVGKLHALYLRHEALVEEMNRRGYNHYSSLSQDLAVGDPVQTKFVDTIERQYEILREKSCDCVTT